MLRWLAVLGLVLLPAAAAADVSVGFHARIQSVDDRYDDFLVVGAAGFHFAAATGSWRFTAAQSLHSGLHATDSRDRESNLDPTRLSATRQSPEGSRAFGVAIGASLPVGEFATRYERLEPDVSVDALLASRSADGETRIQLGMGLQRSNEDVRLSGDDPTITSLRLGLGWRVPHGRCQLEPRGDLRFHLVPGDDDIVTVALTLNGTVEVGGGGSLDVMVSGALYDRLGDSPERMNALTVGVAFTSTL